MGGYEMTTLTLEPLSPKKPRPATPPPAVTRWELGAMARRRLSGGLMLDTTGDLFDQRCADNPLLATATPRAAGATSVRS